MNQVSRSVSGAVGELAGLPDMVAMAADQVRTAVAVGLRMHDQHGLADIGRHRVLAGQRADLAVEHHMGRDQLAHHLHGVGIGLAERVVGLELALLVARHIQVLLADVVDPVVAQRLAGAVLQAVARQHHHGAVHAGDDMPGDHRAARGAVIDEHAGAVAFQRSTTCSPGLISVSAPPPSAPVAEWKSILCGIALVSGLTSVSST